MNELNNLINFHFKIVTDFSLWKTLFPDFEKNISRRKNKNSIQKFSRAEAFFDIVRRHKKSAISGDTIDVDASINSLAEAWGWNRPATLKFLRELQDVKAVSLQALPTHTIVRLNNITETNVSCDV